MEPPARATLALSGLLSSDKESIADGPAAAASDSGDEAVLVAGVLHSDAEESGTDSAAMVIRYPGPGRLPSHLWCCERSAKD